MTILPFITAQWMFQERTSHQWPRDSQLCSNKNPLETLRTYNFVMELKKPWFEVEIGAKSKPRVSSSVGHESRKHAKREKVGLERE